MDQLLLNVLSQEVLQVNAMLDGWLIPILLIPALVIVAVAAFSLLVVYKLYKKL